MEINGNNLKLVCNHKNICDNRNTCPGKLGRTKIEIKEDRSKLLSDRFTCDVVARPVKAVSQGKELPHDYYSKSDIYELAMPYFCLMDWIRSFVDADSRGYLHCAQFKEDLKYVLNNTQLNLTDNIETISGGLLQELKASPHMANQWIEAGFIRKVHPPFRTFKRGSMFIIKRGGTTLKCILARTDTTKVGLICLGEDFGNLYALPVECGHTKKEIDEPTLHKALGSMGEAQIDFIRIDESGNNEYTVKESGRDGEKS